MTTSAPHTASTALEEPAVRPGDATDEHLAPPHTLQPWAAEVLDPRSRTRLGAGGDLRPGRYLAFQGPAGPRFLRLDSEITYLGRSFAADVRLDEPSVSRRQAIVRSRSTGTRLLDDGSLNGTWVNGRRIADAPLADGDVIRVGRVVMVYYDVPG